MSETAHMSVPREDWSARLDTLQRMIERLGAPGAGVGGAERRLEGAGCLESLLDEIDEAVMPRRLVFRNARHERLELEVRNRRLFRALFNSPDSPGLAGHETGAFPLSYADASRLSALGNALRGFCEGTPLTVTTLPAASEPELDETGVAATILRHLLRDPVCDGAGHASRAAALGDFAADCAPWSRAWVLGAGPDLVEHGDASLAHGLARALGTFGERLDALAGGDPLALVLVPEDAAQERIAFFTAGSARAALLVDPETQDALLGRWSDWLAGQSGP